METSVLDTQVAPELAVAEMPQCNHQWMIDSPNGPQSRGECDSAERSDTSKTTSKAPAGATTSPSTSFVATTTGFR